jgi:hypothetical protein
MHVRGIVKFWEGIYMQGALALGEITPKHRESCDKVTIGELPW